jgi:hypothetical protein
MIDSQLVQPTCSPARARLPDRTPRTAPIIVNSSRAILYASAGDDFAEAARREALKTREALQAARADAQTLSG